MISAAGVLFCVVFFGWNAWGRDRLARLLTPFTGMTATLPLRSAEMITRIPLYGLPGILAYLGFLVSGTGLVIPAGARIEPLLEGIALGVGLAAVSSTVASAAFTVAYRVAGNGGGAAAARADIRALKDTGWMRGYMLAQRNFRPWVFVLLSALSVLGEEISFRGVMLPLLAHDLGPVAGVLLTTVAFIATQKVMMPSWLVASIPMGSALVVGLILGYLALTTQSMTLVVVAHICFYLVSVLVLF